jgi:Ca2+-dependent lipid-binding protein
MEQKTNKTVHKVQLHNFIVAISIILVGLSLSADPPKSGWPLLGIVVVANVLSFFLFKRWRKMLSIVIIVASVAVFYRESIEQSKLDQRMKLNRQVLDNYMKTNSLSPK